MADNRASNIAPARSFTADEMDADAYIRIIERIDRWIDLFRFLISPYETCNERDEHWNEIRPIHSIVRYLQTLKSVYRHCAEESLTGSVSRNDRSDDAVVYNIFFGRALFPYDVVHWFNMFRDLADSAPRRIEDEESFEYLIDVLVAAATILHIALILSTGIFP
ncbi:hypothetical protein SPI_03473 [Niveomyces insectorum RCEF 264]|uniref:Uncharacterized protein n=1 Tax=Niveomyces insectorum RCEF 264 TaxID=1081102 RepID=A0A162MKI3_9HYPO|nr:hypothetical protein SPI_03473 [Niveomyces insectorum RCEF 264]